MKIHSLSVSAVHFDEGIDLSLAGNLVVNGILTVDGVEFPLNPTVSDISKVLAVNSSSNYQLMPLYQERFACEFKSLFGVFQTGVELDQFSGLFDFGVPRNWLTGWNAYLFDSAEMTAVTGDNIPGVDFLVPGTDSNVNMSNLNTIETYNTSNMNFNQFLNISMYKQNGRKHTNLSGIAVSDSANVVTPNYYYLLGTVDPNSELFKYKFKHDFDAFHNPTTGITQGYSAVMETVRVPHHSFHKQGTNMFMVEFINTYKKSFKVGDEASTGKENSKYLIPTTEADRISNYHILNEDGVESEYKTNEIGLFPHITYTLWRNSLDPCFYTTKSNNEIGWSNGDSNAVFDMYSNNGMLQTLYTETYKFITDNYTITGTYKESLDTHINTMGGSNLMFHSNMNSNGYFVDGNYNRISFKADVTFPSV
jgi:hypothetical protein